MRTLRTLAAFHDQARTAAAPPAECGVVIAVGPEWLTVNVFGSEEQVAPAAGLQVRENDTVAIMRTRGVPIAVGVVPSDEKTQPVFDELPMDLSGVAYIPAAYSFSWQSGSVFSYESTVRQGSITGGDWAGCWFYQGMVGAEVEGYTVDSLAVRLTRGQGGTPGPQDVSVFLSSSGTWPTDDLERPAPSGSAQVLSLSTSESGWLDLPTAWAADLVAGSGLMVAGSGAPMVILQGVDTESESGLIRIDWSFDPGGS